MKRRACEKKKSHSGNVFCNRSCSASFHNTLRRNSNRSKVEMKLYAMLKEKYPQLEMIPNDKTMLNGLEVDIAIPSLKLAVEWNGIVHFKPIYGQERLAEIQQRDQTKLQLANTQNINLIVITDLVSSDKKVREAFEQICDIIADQIKR